MKNDSGSEMLSESFQKKEAVHMEAKDYLKIISEDIHRTIVATVDDEGLPVTAAIDMMDSDDNGLYFLTAKGKNFYDRLIETDANPHLRWGERNEQ